MNWLPLMDYAVRKGVSLSTLRRRIKANQVTYKVEGGKYLLLDAPLTPLAGPASSGAFVQPAWPVAPMTTPTRVEGLRSSDDLVNALRAEFQGELKKLHEEIAELKMLIALYEERLAPPR